MPDQPTAVEIARRLADTLANHNLPYAIGGAIALGFYAPPRATVDVDVNVFVAPDDRLQTVLTALADVDFEASTDIRTLAQQARADGQFRGTVAGLRVDVFVPAISYYAELEVRRRAVPLLGRPIWILGPEDIAVLKMMFFRRKDVADVEALLRDMGASIDRTFVRSKLIELVGKDDERLAALTAIERDVDSEC